MQYFRSSHIYILLASIFLALIHNNTRRDLSGICLSRLCFHWIFLISFLALTHDKTAYLICTVSFSYMQCKISIKFPSQSHSQENISLSLFSTYIKFKRNFCCISVSLVPLWNAKGSYITLYVCLFSFAYTVTCEQFWPFVLYSFDFLSPSDTLWKMPFYPFLTNRWSWPDWLEQFKQIKTTSRKRIYQKNLQFLVRGVIKRYFYYTPIPPSMYQCSYSVIAWNINNWTPILFERLKKYFKNQIIISLAIHS